jgi:uncharacterized protein (TIGR03032 family)
LFSLPEGESLFSKLQKITIVYLSGVCTAVHIRPVRFAVNYGGGRFHQDQLWVLESGTGSLQLIDRSTGQPEVVANLPGFARGLAIVGPYAFIGLSKIRATSAMDGVPLAEHRENLKCGVAVVDLRSGETIALLEFRTAVEEVFDLQLLLGPRFPEVLGFQKETLHHTFVVPTINQ